MLSISAIRFSRRQALICFSPSNGIPDVPILLKIDETIDFVSLREPVDFSALVLLHSRKQIVGDAGVENA